jgi:hypothetical protein
MTTTTEVEAFPGCLDGADGPVLMENMRAQAERLGAEMIGDDIVAADLTGDIKLLTDAVGTVHRAKTDHRDRLRLPQARPAERGSAVRPRGVLVRDLRRVLLP